MSWTALFLMAAGVSAMWLTDKILSLYGVGQWQYSTVPGQKAKYWLSWVGISAALIGLVLFAIVVVLRI